MAIDYATTIDPLYASNVVTDAEYLAVAAANRNQTSEQRILTTIEILRAHMAVLSSDEEARLLHYCVARMLAAMGTNYIYDDTTVQAVGNIPVTGGMFADDYTVEVTIGPRVEEVTLDAAPYASLAAVVTDINTDLTSLEARGTASPAAGDFDNGDTVTITTASGTDAVVLDDAVYADIDAVVTDINSQISNASEVEAFNDGGELSFRNATGDEGVEFVLAPGEGATSVLTVAGIEAGTYSNAVEAYEVGGKLGFRNTTGNEGTVFTLGHGTGPSVLNTAGISAGEFSNRVQEVAAIARDDALAHF